MVKIFIEKPKVVDRKIANILIMIWGSHFFTELNNQPSAKSHQTSGTQGNVSLQVALSKYYEGAKGRMKMADLPILGFYRNNSK